MTSVFLSCYNLPIIKQVAQVLGWIMNLLYQFFAMFDIYNIGLCIILFTIIIKMILLPMTIKQQRFTKLSAVMNPEIQAIQKKYKDKRDQESMMKMNQEMSAVYEKYGTSPTGGCMTLLIQMPILLALYGVVSQIPTFIPEIGGYFENVSVEISESAQYFYDLDNLEEIVDSSAEDTALDNLEKTYYEGAVKDGIIDAGKVAEKFENEFMKISATPEAIFSEVKDAYNETDKIIEKLSAFTADEWTALLDKNKDDAENTALIEKYKAADWNEVKTKLAEDKAAVVEIRDEVYSAYDFMGVNLGQSPSSAGGILSLVIPVLAALTQFLSVKISNKYNASSQNMNNENPMGSSMKMMTYTMPVMSAILCYSLPSGLGVYWVMSAVVQTVQTIVIGKYFLKLEVDDIIKSNVEKVNKKRAKQGLPPKKITAAAGTNVKNIKYEENKPAEKPEQINKSASGKGSISAKANLVSKYNNKK